MVKEEIEGRGLERSGPPTGLNTFSVRVRKRFPVFLRSVNLKLAKLGYHYVLSNALYLLAIPVLFQIFSTEVKTFGTFDLWIL